MALSTEMALLILWVVTFALAINAVRQSWLEPRNKALAYAGVVLLPILGAAAALIMLDPNRAPTRSRLDDRLRDELDKHKDD